MLVDFFQITKENPLIGVSPRVKLLNSVGCSLQSLTDIVGPTGRPGNLVGRFFHYYQILKIPCISADYLLNRFSPVVV